MLCKDNMANLNYTFMMCNTKQIKIFLVLKKFYDKKKKAHIMLNEQCNTMHNSALTKL